MALRNKLYVTVSLPTGLAIAAFYSSTLAEGSDARSLFRMAVTFLMAAVLLGCVTWSVHRVQELSCENVRLAKRMRNLERNCDDIQRTVDSRLAVKAWRSAGLTGTNGRHMWAVRPESPEDN